MSISIAHHKECKTRLVQIGDGSSRVSAWVITRIEERRRRRDVDRWGTQPRYTALNGARHVGRRRRLDDLNNRCFRGRSTESLGGGVVETGVGDKEGHMRISTIICYHYCGLETRRHKAIDMTHKVG